MAKDSVDLILCLPDLICSQFVTDTLLPLMVEPAISRVACKAGLRSEYARSILLHEFLEGKSEYAFLVDADVILASHTLPRLLWHRKKMITGLIFARGENSWPIIFEPNQPLDDWPKRRYFNYPQNTLCEVGACGHSCLLIHRSVLEAMEPPYSQLGPFMGQELVGSDLRLCLKAQKEAGVKLWCDTSIKCGHLMPMPITEEHWLKNAETFTAKWTQAMKEYKAQGG